MEKEILEQVLNYMAPHMRFVMTLVLGRKKEELESLEKRINDGLESGFVKFSDEHSIDIDLRKLEAEKGKEWTEVLRKQLKHLTEIADNFK